MKICKCGGTEFYHRSHGSCKDCVKAYSRARYYGASKSGQCKGRGVIPLSKVAFPPTLTREQFLARYVV